jgi:hypothetical protein
VAALDCADVGGWSQSVYVFGVNLFDFGLVLNERGEHRGHSGNLFPPGTTVKVDECFSARVQPLS